MSIARLAILSVAIAVSACGTSNLYCQKAAAIAKRAPVSISSGTTTGSQGTTTTTASGPLIPGAVPLAGVAPPEVAEDLKRSDQGDAEAARRVAEYTRRECRVDLPTP